MNPNIKHSHPSQRTRTRTMISTSHGMGRAIQIWGSMLPRLGHERGLRLWITGASAWPAGSSPSCNFPHPWEVNYAPAGILLCTTALLNFNLIVPLLRHCFTTRGLKMILEQQWSELGTIKFCSQGILWWKIASSLCLGPGLSRPSLWRCVQGNQPGSLAAPQVRATSGLASGILQ